MKLRNFLNVVFAFVLLAGNLLSAFSQTVGGKASVVTGDVTSIEGGKVVVQTKDGALQVTLTEKTEYKRVPPENPVLAAAVASSLADIGVGDKLLVTGFFSADKATLAAKSVFLMTKSDITQRQVKERELWAAKGISGRVSAVDQITRQIKVDVRGLANTTTVVLTPKEGAKVLRYAPNSVKFSEAKPSSVNEIQAGDMLRALGDRSEDGASFAAEEIVTGAFRTVVGTVKTVDVANNEVVLTDAQSKKDVTVELGSASVLKKFPEEMAQRMAAMQSGQAGGMRPAGGSGTSVGAPPQPNGAPAGGQAGPNGPGRGFGGARGIDDMLERFPNITAADLKTGDVIAVSSTKNDTSERITAIKLLAGVEPFLRVAQAQAARGGQRGQGSLSLDIPGLDGFGGP
ncbi:MAG: hypothetical protein ABI857_01005 [Acidobacteriota bacterium]